MDIIIKNTDEKPIYDQIASQIKTQILNGKLQQGDALPSMRHLAKELRISLITTKRAYEELEKDGLIASFVGKGSFVKSVNSELAKENNLREIEDLMSQITEISTGCGISYEQILLMFENIYKGE